MRWPPAEHTNSPSINHPNSTRPESTSEALAPARAQQMVLTVGDVKPLRVTVMLVESWVVAQLDTLAGTRHKGLRFGRRPSPRGSNTSWLETGQSHNSRRCLVGGPVGRLLRSVDWMIATGATQLLVLSVPLRMRIDSP
jgi:hypothetical protein